jgi:hypothetical protein
MLCLFHPRQSSIPDAHTCPLRRFPLFAQIPTCTGTGEEVVNSRRAREISESGIASSLRSLSLANNEFAYDGALILTQGYLSQLEFVDLHGNSFDPVEWLRFDQGVVVDRSRAHVPENFPKASWLERRSFPVCSFNQTGSKPVACGYRWLRSKGANDQGSASLSSQSLGFRGVLPDPDGSPANQLSRCRVNRAVPNREL